MSTTEHAVRLSMRTDFQRMVENIRARRTNPENGKPGTVIYAWRHCYRLGLTVDEETFLQWHAESEHRLLPLVTHGATGEALARIGVAERTEGRERYLVDPMAWRRWCAKTADTRLPTMNIIWEGKSHDTATIDLEMSDPADVQLYLEMEERSTRARRLARQEQPDVGEGFALTDAEILSGVAAARARVQGQSRSNRQVPLPANPDDAFHWLPFASGPSTIYWLWRWSVTKDKLRAAIRTHAQWSVDYKHGFLITDMDAVRWAWDLILPVSAGRGTFGQIMNALGSRVQEPRVERKMREQLVQLMAQPLGHIHWRADMEFGQFDAAMAAVREKTRRLIEGGDAAPHVPVKQLHRWFEVSTTERNDDDKNPLT